MLNHCWALLTYCTRLVCSSNKDIVCSMGQARFVGWRLINTTINLKSQDKGAVEARWLPICRPVPPHTKMAACLHSKSACLEGLVGMVAAGRFE